MKIFRSYFLLFAVSLLSCKKEQDNKGYLRPSGLGQPNYKAKPLAKKNTMTKFELNDFTTIDGVGASSGIVYYQNNLYIVGDNSGFLYKYNIENKDLNKFELTKNAQENTPKKIKADFESITFQDGKLQIFGSGSTKKRNSQFTVDLASGVIKKTNVKDLYSKFLELAKISKDDLNIEGIFFYKHKQYFFQRGNGLSGINGVFVVDLLSNGISFTPIELPKIKDLQTSFTDAIAFQGKCYFLATAENSSSTFLDGEILGSVFGCLNLENFTVEYFHQISTTKKMEGLAIYEDNSKSTIFLLCEDNDLNELKSNIYNLIIYK